MTALMNTDQKILIKYLNSVGSGEAAAWLMEKYPIDGEEWGQAITLLSHRSWATSDQLRLARYYLKKLPFANDQPYRAFASIMSISNFLKVIGENLPVQKERRSLLSYHLAPILKTKLESDSDKVLAERFLSQLG